jgi:hypothetical protein
MIQISKISDSLFSNEKTLLHKKLIHIVCQADKNSGSYCMQYLNECQFSIDKSVKYIDQVNQKNEVGCLYPKYNLSLIPNIDLTSDLQSKQHQLEIYLTDAIINANELYYKSETMLFVFEKSNMPNTQEIIQIFEQFIEKQAGRIKHLNILLTNLE